MSDPGDPLADAIAVVGPTASGKSALALSLAAALARSGGAAELVSVDSMQVYRGMDIGTAKPTLAEREAVAHHLLDLLDPHEECSVAWFQREAHRALAGIAGRGATAVLVGGTGLYHRAVVDRLSIPPQHPDVRAELEREVELAPDPVAATARLHAELAGLDPAAAARIEPTNTRRVVRALEVVRGSGRPFSSFGAGLEEYPPSPVRMIGLRVDRAALTAAIAGRVHRMMLDGFLEEVERLHGHSPPLSRTAAQALGYRELLVHLEGRSTLEEAVAETVLRTRQFAVRQERWFRRDPRIEWVDAPGSAAETPAWAEVTASRLVAR